MRVFILMLLLTLVSGCALQSPMVVSTTADGKYWVLTEPMKYEQPQTKQKFTVPRGFVTDLASVPRLFWSAFPPCGNYTPAAVVHDYLYWYQPKDCNRKCADNLLLVAMEESGVDYLTRKAIYTGVRAGGQSSWDDNKAAKAAGVIRKIPEKFMNYGPYDTWKQIEARIHSDSKTTQLQ